MLGKLLLTLLVIVLAALFIRQRARNRRQRPPNGANAAGNSAPARDNPWGRGPAQRRSPDIPADGRRFRPGSGRLAAWTVLAVILAAGLGLYYLGWREARQPVTVILYGNESEPVVYEVRRSELGDRVFTTLDGRRVTVSASERMEVVGL